MAAPRGRRSRSRIGARGRVRLNPVIALGLLGFIIAGRSTKSHVLSAFESMCGVCGPGATYARIMVRYAFSLFWIPVLPVGHSLWVKCQRCGNEFQERGWTMDMSGGLALLAVIAILFFGVSVGTTFGGCYVGAAFVVLAIIVTVGWMHTTPHSEGVVPGTVPGAFAMPPGAGAAYAEYPGYPGPGPQFAPAPVCPRCHSPARFDTARNAFFCPVCGIWI